MEKKVISFAILLSALSFSAVSQPLSLKANQRTALRYLSDARTALERHEWREAASYAEMGLSYDERISDLWYYKAVAANALGRSRADVLEASAQAVMLNSWFDYNKDNARILYADVLCDSHDEAEALKQLSNVPALTSADAEYIRAKCFYHTGDVAAARAKIDQASKFYPTDARFPLLFFQAEFVRYQDEPAYPAAVRTLADFFIRSRDRFSEYSSDDFEFYTALFARGDERRRLLRTYDSSGARHELFAAIALQNGILSENDALDYLFSFDELHRDTIEHFVPLITDSEAKEALVQHFSDFSGVIFSDTDGDGIDDFSVKYEKGRPAKIVWDKSQTGVNLWTFDCDYGTPVRASIDDDYLKIIWDYYPSVITAVFNDGEEAERLLFNVLPDMFSWTPLEMELSPALAALGANFYEPSVKNPKRVAEPKSSDFLPAASSYEVPSKERDGAKIVFQLYNGKIQFATYFDDGKIYARTHFSDGVPIIRIVDNTGNGVYETTELYGLASGVNPDYYAIEDERQVMINLFGSIPKDAHFFLKSVQINNSNDINADFSEEYLQGSGKIASWDTDGDAKWNVRYYRSGDFEESQFYLEPGHELVRVITQNGEPVKISRGKIERDVKKASDADFFWINETGSKEDAESAVAALAEVKHQGICVVIDKKEYRINAVKIGTDYFGEIVKADRDLELLRLADELNLLEKNTSQ